MMPSRRNLPFWVLAIGALGLFVHPELADPIGISTGFAFTAAAIWSLMDVQ